MHHPYTVNSFQFFNYYYYYFVLQAKKIRKFGDFQRKNRRARDAGGIQAGIYLALIKATLCLRGEIEVSPLFRNLLFKERGMRSKNHSLYTLVAKQNCHGLFHICSQSLLFKGPCFSKVHPLSSMFQCKWLFSIWEYFILKKAVPHFYMVPHSSFLHSTVT